MYAIVRNKRRFEALRTFTLESGQAEIERRNRRRKEAALEQTDTLTPSRRGSVDSVRSPSGSHNPTLSDVPEEDGAFAIGDNEDSDAEDDHNPTPTHSVPSETRSRPSSISSTVEDAVPTQLRGMSEKARGKMPVGAPTFSRQNSMTSLGSYSAAAIGADGLFAPTGAWIESWLPELPLHTILTIVQQLETVISLESVQSDSVSIETLRAIQESNISGVERSAIRIHSFEWSPLSLGWYESLLWSFVFTSEMQVAKGTVGVWNGTQIKLFRVQETAAEGPTLSSPRGAVDAVGSNIVNRIGSINLRGSALGSDASRQTSTSRENTGSGERRSGSGSRPQARSAVV